MEDWKFAAPTYFDFSADDVPPVDDGYFGEAPSRRIIRSIRNSLRYRCSESDCALTLAPLLVVNTLVFQIPIGSSIRTP